MSTQVRRWEQRAAAEIEALNLSHWTRTNGEGGDRLSGCMRGRDTGGSRGLTRIRGRTAGRRSLCVSFHNPRSRAFAQARRTGCLCTPAPAQENSGRGNSEQRRRPRDQPSPLRASVIRRRALPGADLQEFVAVGASKGGNQAAARARGTSVAEDDELVSTRLHPRDAESEPVALPGECRRVPPAAPAQEHVRGLLRKPWGCWRSARTVFPFTDRTECASRFARREQRDRELRRASRPTATDREIDELAGDTNVRLHPDHSDVRIGTTYREEHG